MFNKIKDAVKGIKDEKFLQYCKNDPDFRHLVSSSVINNACCVAAVIMYVKGLAGKKFLAYCVGCDVLAMTSNTIWLIWAYKQYKTNKDFYEPLIEAMEITLKDNNETAE